MSEFTMTSFQAVSEAPEGLIEAKIGTLFQVAVDRQHQARAGNLVAGQWYTRAVQGTLQFTYSHAKAQRWMADLKLMMGTVDHPFDPFYDLVRSYGHAIVGWEACSRLAHDFTCFDDRAKGFVCADLDSFYRMYQEMKSLFRYASDRGYVEFTHT